MKYKLTHAELLQRLHYDKDSGIFLWKYAGFRKRIIGQRAGRIAKNGYLHIGLFGSSFLAHRLAWFYVYGAWPMKDIDHIDGNKLNNSIANLREATRSQNRQNLKSALAKKSNLPLGVRRGKRIKRDVYLAIISIDGQRRYIGTYSTANEAHEAYMAAKLKLHPFAVAAI